MTIVTIIAAICASRLNQKKAKYAHRLLKLMACLQTVVDLTFSQVRLADPQVQSSKIQDTLRLWATQSTCVVNRAARRSILAGASSLVDSAKAILGDFDA